MMRASTASTLRRFGLTARRPLVLALCFGLLVAVPGCGDDDPYDPNSIGVRRYGIPPAPGSRSAKVDDEPAPSPPPILPVDDKPDDDPGKPPIRPGRSAKPKKAGKYKVDKALLENAGTISGVVKFASKPAPLAMVATNKDNPTCGHEQSPSERLIFDEKTLTAKNAVVYIESIDAGRPFQGRQAEKEPYFEIDQKECRYIPHISVVKPKTSLSISNSDGVVHNIHGYRESKATDVFNFFTPANVQKKRDQPGTYLKKAGTYLVHCDIHPWMNAIVHVLPHPYYAVTDMDGKFELRHVPPGKYRLVMWKEGFKETPSFAAGAISGYSYGPDIVQVKDVEVTAKGTATVNFEIPAK